MSTTDIPVDNGVNVRARSGPARLAETGGRRVPVARHHLCARHPPSRPWSRSTASAGSSSTGRPSSTTPTTRRCSRPRTTASRRPSTSSWPTGAASRPAPRHRPAARHPAALGVGHDRGRHGPAASSAPTRIRNGPARRRQARHRRRREPGRLGADRPIAEALGVFDAPPTRPTSTSRSIAGSGSQDAPLPVVVVGAGHSGRP